MAARKAQTILTPQRALAFVAERGIVCESSRRGDIPSLVDEIVGAPMRGNWWSHARSQEIFKITRAVRDAHDILTCRLVDGKITFVHFRLWPAVVRCAHRFAAERLARVQETHTASGKHEVETQPFPEWVPSDIAAKAAKMAESDASHMLAPLLDDA